jgi:hypothetical protein
VYKAKAELKKVYKSVIDSRFQALKSQQIAEAEIVKDKLSLLSEYAGSATRAASDHEPNSRPIVFAGDIDPESQLKIKTEDKTLDVMDESDFLLKIVRSPYITGLGKCH